VLNGEPAPAVKSNVPALNGSWAGKRIETPTDELTKLLLAARDGDRIALGAWIRQSQPEVWRLCARLVRRDQADDVTQEVYLRAYRALRGFRADSTARTWLLSIARRTCADAVRELGRQRRLNSRLEHSASIPAVEPDQARSLVADALLSGLNADQRVAFVLTQILGLSYAEAGQVCDCPVGTIRSRVARARVELIPRLEEAVG
jgi:RNA polymerase sigma-70 factor (ECF subfamily)